MSHIWKTGMICPVYKKGDKLVYENYRGITLLMIGERVKSYAEEILGEYQCGFRPCRSTTDQIFVMKQIMERFYEYDVDIHILFVDFRQAFDSVRRNGLQKAFQEYQPKIIQLIRMTMSNTKARVKVNNTLSKEFEFKTGVKQGDGLSAILFDLALHKVINVIDQRGTIFGK